MGDLGCATGLWWAWVVEGAFVNASDEPRQMPSQELLRLTNVGRSYRGSPPVRVLAGVNLSLHAGEVIGVVGRSGSGKSTLLNVLGLLDRPTEGEYRIAGEAVSGMSDRQQTRLRSRFFGFVFQQSFLLSSLSAQENVELGLRPRRLAAAERSRRAVEALASVGLEHRRRFLPSKMSGGECQRVAIARALAQQPSVLLCDEPTGNLDETTSAAVIRMLVDSRPRNAAVVIVTHDMAIARKLPRLASVRDGVVSEGAGEFSRAAALTSGP